MYVSPSVPQTGSLNMLQIIFSHVWKRFLHFFKFTGNTFRALPELKQTFANINFFMHLKVFYPNIRLDKVVKFFIGVTHKWYIFLKSVYIQI